MIKIFIPYLEDLLCKIKKYTKLAQLYSNNAASTLGLSALKANNLSDLTSASTAQTNLELGTLATQSGTFSGSSSGTNTGDQDLSGYELLFNKQTDLSPSTTKYPIVNAVNTGLALKANITSPSFTGTPNLPLGTIGVTQSPGDNTTALATTAFVITENNLKANIASPIFTGTVKTDGIKYNTSTKTTSYIITSNDYTIRCDATSIAFSITLPTASSVTGQVFEIKKIDSTANAITIVGILDGVSNRTLTIQYSNYAIQSNGTTYDII